MDSALRPRDIQSRIRHGESPESVAEAARVTVDQLMPFAGPVLNERAHVAERAQRSSVRRRQPEPGAGARTLGDAVEGQLVRLDSVDWDAWRRDDGRWTLEATFTGERRSGSARFTYDAPGNYVTLDNDDAQWLVGDLAEPAAVEAPRRRLAAVVAPPVDPGPLGDQLILDDELGDDALDLVRGEEPPAPEAPVRSEVHSEPESEPAAVGHPSEQQVRRPATASSRRRGRASVPSWDEIMFGGQSEQ